MGLLVLLEDVEVLGQVEVAAFLVGQLLSYPALGQVGEVDLGAQAEPIINNDLAGSILRAHGKVESSWWVP